MHKKNRIGETALATNGQVITIIAYRKSNNIDVQFEDGYVACHKTYAAFKKGMIKNPNKPYTRAIVNSRIGETAIAANGQKMTIIAYRNSHDIDVQFEDGYVTYHTRYYCFEKGIIKNPNKPYTQAIQTIINSHIGETSIATNGQKMTIIAYRNGKDIDIQFEDRYVACHKTYASFKKGMIKNPNKPYTRAMIDDRIGETTIATNGQKMTIIAYQNGHDIDVQFEDGYVTCHKQYESFKKGGIKNPHFPMQDKGTYKTFQTQYAYTAPNGNVYFYCTCQKCSFKKNLTALELINLNHVC